MQYMNDVMCQIDRSTLCHFQGSNNKVKCIRTQEKQIARCVIVILVRVIGAHGKSMRVAEIDIKLQPRAIEDLK